MKKVLYLLLLFSMFMITCKELDKFTMFDIPYETSYTIPALPQIHIPVEIWAPPVPTYSDSIFQAYGTSSEMIEEVTLKELRLVISSGGKANFDFLQSISFYLAGENIVEKEVAWLYEVPKDSKDTLFLKTTSDNLRLYLTEDTLMIKIKVLTDSATTMESEIGILTLFHVDAKILGL